MHARNKLPRQENSPYKPSNLWDAREHAIFLKYCSSKRDRCYHAMANDMSARPHEILNLKIKDIIFKVTEDGVQFAEVLITGGKTKLRTLPLIDSIPYLKDWIHDHRTGTNPDSWLFVSLASNTFDSKLTHDGLFGHYKYYYKAQYFPKLIEDETVPEADKAFIRNMLTKPWNLYVFRHSASLLYSKISCGLDFILSHFQEPIFPRKIMTKDLGYQVEVFSREEALEYFKSSNYQDCRINAYPSFTEYKGINRTPISFLMVDLDLKDFGGRGGVQQEYSLKKALNKALEKIKKEKDRGEGEVGSIVEIQPCYGQVMVIIYTSLLADLFWKNMKHSMNLQNTLTKT